MVGIRRTRPRRYELKFRQALKVLWEAAGYICSERLHPFLSDLLPLLERHGQIKVDEPTKKLLATASLATVERNLHDLRRGLVSRRMSQTKPGTLLKNQIPLQTGTWDVSQPGFMEADTVAHCGNSLAGDFV